MIRNGALQFRRLLAMMMTLAMLLVSSAPALAAKLWDELVLNILWTDSLGETHVFPAQPIPGSAERSYWAVMDPAALGQEVTLAAEHPDGRYAFFLQDEWGSPVNTFTWYHEMDALSADYAFAHNVFYTTDGIPGDMPVYLYLSSAAMPQEDTFVAFPVSVPVYYVTEDGDTLDVQYVECWAGETTPVWAASSGTSGYSLIGSDTVQVTVDKAGYASPSEIRFTYRQNATPTPEPTEAPTPEPTEEPTPVPTEIPEPDPVVVDVVVNYYHVDLGLLDSQVVTLKEGTALVRANSSKTAGYEPVGSTSVEVAVFEDGTTHPGVVEFYYQDAYVAPSEATITVHYQDERGRDVTPAESFTVTGDGEYPITARADLLPEGYELVPGLHTEVIVSVKKGVPSQSDVYFYVQQKQAAPAMANVTVHYYDVHGAEIASAQMVPLQPGKHYLKPDATRIPRGYELATEASILVEVYENGTFFPQEIGFYYQKSDEKTVPVTVYFKDDRGNDVATPITENLANGTHVVKANPADLKPGYELFPGVSDTAEVTVRNGAATPSKVVFYYQKTETEPTYFDIPVFYKDTLGNQIADTQYVRVQPGTNYSVKANPQNLPAGAELMMEQDLPFTVYDDGTTEPEELAFYYRVNTKQAEVTVSYTDDRGRLIADPFTVKLAPGSHTIQADFSRVPAGYDPYSAKAVEIVVSSEGKATPREAVLVFQRQVVETPIPVGEDVNRYATVKSADVALRNEPTTSGGNKTVIKRMSRNSKVFVLQELYNDKHEVWAMVNVDGRIGYMMSSYLDVMTQQGSDAYAAGSTPVPTFTPVPQATHTLEPLPHETATPTASPTATPAPYHGYALTKRATALRNGVSASDMTILRTLDANELVTVIDQIIDQQTGDVWSIVSTLDNQPGYVLHSALREITEREAQPYIEYWVEVNKTPEPTQLVTATPEPPQMSGYGVVIGENVPFRQMESDMSRIIDVLDANTVVYVTGQTPGDGQYWHTVNYQGHWGYIRAELVRMMTIAEEEEYVESQRATPTPSEPPQSFDEYGLSSYGYVDGSTVNWRQSPSKRAPNVEGRRELKRYAFCLVLGTEYVDGVTWYHVSYGDKTGYIHGDFFKQMTIAELEGFLGSDEYLQGVTSNSGTLDEEFSGTGSIVSPEDQWVSNNPGSFPTFVPFNPIGTVQPIATSSPTLEPLPGWATDAPTATPSPTPTFNPLPDVTYPTGDDGQGGSGILWVLVIGLLLLAGGGVFALVRYNQNRRRIALRAAQRRAQAARAQQMQQRPYARTGQPNQPRTGMYQQQVRRPEGQENPYAPYNGAASYGTYFRPAEEEENEGSTPANTQRPGRRTAYRQAQEAARQNQEDNELNM